MNSKNVFPPSGVHQDPAPSNSALGAILEALSVTPTSAFRQDMALPGVSDALKSQFMQNKLGEQCSTAVGDQRNNDNYGPPGNNQVNKRAQKQLYKQNVHLEKVEEGIRETMQKQQNARSSVNLQEQTLGSTAQNINIGLVRSFLQDKLYELPDSILPMENTPVTSSRILENLRSRSDVEAGQQSANLNLGAPLQLMLSDAGIPSSSAVSNGVYPVAADTKMKNQMSEFYNCTQDSQNSLLEKRRRPHQRLSRGEQIIADYGPLSIGVTRQQLDFNTFKLVHKLNNKIWPAKSPCNIKLRNLKTKFYDQLKINSIESCKSADLQKLLDIPKNSGYQRACNHGQEFVGSSGACQFQSQSTPYIQQKKLECLIDQTNYLDVSTLTADVLQKSIPAYQSQLQLLEKNQFTSHQFPRRISSSYANGSPNTTASTTGHSCPLNLNLKVSPITNARKTNSITSLETQDNTPQLNSYQNATDQAAKMQDLVPDAKDLENLPKTDPINSKTQLQAPGDSGTNDRDVTEQAEALVDVLQNMMLSIERKNIQEDKQAQNSQNREVEPKDNQTELLIALRNSLEQLRQQVC